MANAYTKMKPDSFKLQLQAVLTTYYEDIKGVQGASGCHKTRIVKRQFKDHEDDTCNEGVDAADAAAGGGAAVLQGATPAQARRAPAAAGRRLQLLHLPLSGRRGHGVLIERLLRLMLIKEVCLNLNRCDTWQQPDPDIWNPDEVYSRYIPCIFHVYVQRQYIPRIYNGY